MTREIRAGADNGGVKTQRDSTASWPLILGQTGLAAADAKYNKKGLLLDTLTMFNQQAFQWRRGRTGILGWHAAFNDGVVMAATTFLISWISTAETSRKQKQYSQQDKRILHLQAAFEVEEGKTLLNSASVSIRPIKRHGRMYLTIYSANQVPTRVYPPIGCRVPCGGRRAHCCDRDTERQLHYRWGSTAQQSYYHTPLLQERKIYS
ncbi:hypothetical protein BaRGS_00026919 [Batillaria attramentaria]|uniref:Uncharacterized protein n=1 Tax=Batillaria attramentaria TaxID=370345 RepID=A0ABD0K493_9CAEN